MQFPQFNLPWKGPPVEPDRRARLVYLKAIVDGVAAEVTRIIDSMDVAEKTVYEAAYDCLDTALSALEGASSELDDAEFQFTRPGAKSLGEVIREVLRKEEQRE